MSSNLDRAIGAGVTFSSVGPVAGSLDDVGVGCAINERSPTFSLHVGGDVTRTKDRWEIGFCYVVNLLNARSTKVDAIEGTSSDGGNDLTDFADGQGTGDGLNVGKGLGYAQLVFVRSISKTDSFPNGGVSLLHDGNEGRGLGVADDGLEVRSTTSGHVGDNNGQVIVGAGAERAETFQPIIDRSNSGATGSLQENLEKTVGIETRGTRGSSDGNEGTLALSGNAADLSKCAADSGSKKKRASKEHNGR